LKVILYYIEILLWYIEMFLWYIKILFEGSTALLEMVIIGRVWVEMVNGLVGLSSDWITFFVPFFSFFFLLFYFPYNSGERVRLDNKLLFFSWTFIEIVLASFNTRLLVRRSNKLPSIRTDNDIELCVYACSGSFCMVQLIAAARLTI
jgi:hypothetical protein